MQPAPENVGRLGEEKHLLAPEAAPAVRARSVVTKAPGTPLADVTTEAGAAPADDALAQLGESLAMPVCSGAELVPEPAALAAVTREAAQRAGALPLALRGAVLRVAVADPFAPALEALAQEARVALDPVLAPVAEIRAALARFYAPVDAPPAEPAVPGTSSEPETGDDAPMARLVQHLVEEAILLVLAILE